MMLVKFNKLLNLNYLLDSKRLQSKTYSDLFAGLSVTREANEQWQRTILGHCFVGFFVGYAPPKARQAARWGIRVDI